MRIRRRGVRRPRLAPELDDLPLGNVRTRLAAARTVGRADTEITAAQQVLRQTGTDWDRRAHRVGVLADVAFSLARHWHELQPENPDATVLRAWSQWSRLRRAAADPDWSTGGAAIDPEKTLNLCRRAAQLSPYDPIPWVIRLGLLRLHGRPREAILPVWEEIRKRDAWNREACLQVLGYLSPEEQGSLAELLDFVDSVQAVMPPGAPAAALPLLTSVRDYHRRVAAGGALSGLEAARFWTQPQAARVLDRALRDLLSPDFLGTAVALADLNLLAYALVKADRADDAAPVFLKIDGIVTPWPWGMDGDPVERFTYWQRRSLD
ncbi:hypothetical protein AB0N07_29240 [Streptomyces sp. NPDC051172]|uniref:hypothetical protein n=1 Tax=Streptomyces sp. NPDC051172 TaxID=3155796 RepID=UPI003422D633